MSSSLIWQALVIVDEIHYYLQFLLPGCTFLSLAFIFKENKIIPVAGFLIFSLCLILIATLNFRIENLIYYTFILFSQAIIFFGLLSLENFQNTKKFFQITSLLGLFAFLFSQAILGGCFIHWLQNFIANRFLRLDSWYELKVFGADYLSSSILRLFYFKVSFLLLILTTLKVVNLNLYKKSF